MTNSLNTLLPLHNPPINLPPQLLTQYRLAREVRIQRKRPNRHLLRTRVLHGQFPQVGHKLLQAWLVVPELAAFAVDPVEHLGAESCLGGWGGDEGAVVGT